MEHRQFMAKVENEEEFFSSYESAILWAIFKGDLLGVSFDTMLDCTDTYRSWIAINTENNKAIVCEICTIITRY